MSAPLAALRIVISSMKNSPEFLMIFVRRSPEPFPIFGSYASETIGGYTKAEKRPISFMYWLWNPAGIKRFERSP